MFRKVKLGLQGEVYLHSMPARKECWNSFQLACEKHQIKNILSLTGIAEIEEKSPEYAKAIKQQNLNTSLDIFSIEDFSTPVDQQQYAALIQSQVQQLKSGDSILIHCAAGIGRTGSAAICLLKELGMITSDAILLVADAGSGPETTGQLEFVESYSPAV